MTYFLLAHLFSLAVACALGAWVNRRIYP